MEAARTGAPLAVDGASAPSRYLLKLASDEKLVGRVRGGSEQAFAVLYERHHRSILSFCRHMLGSREEAEDALQQAFANAFRAMLGNDRELNVKPWLYRIARNQCISALRARRRDSELADDEPSLVGLSDQVAQRDELRDLLRDLAGLPVDQREALVLAELHDNSHAEVATIIGCEKEKVKSLVFQARRSLIKSREAREAPCEEIRRQLSVLRGGALRRNTIRRHLQHCEGCRAFRHEVKHQRQALAVILPVVPSVALKLGAANAMAATAAIGGSLAAGGSGAAVVAGSGATAAGGSGAAAGPLAALAGKLGVSAVAVKGAAATVAVTVAAGGGAVAVKEVREPARGQTPIASEQSADRGSGRSPGGTGEPGGVTPSGPAGVGAATIVADLGPGKGDERAARRKARRARRGRRARDPLALQERAQRRAERRLASKRARPVPLTPDERARRKADRRKAARERRLERRQRREQSQRPKRRRATKEPGRRKPAARKPARRRAQPPVGTTPLEPAPTDPPPENRGPTFPPR